MKAQAALATFPSKIYTIMAAGRPSIVCAESGSDLAKIVETYHCGLAIEPGNPRMLAASIQQARTHPNQFVAMGHSGREAAEQYFTIAHTSEKYDTLFAALLTGLVIDPPETTAQLR